MSNIKSVDPVFDAEREIKLTDGTPIVIRPFTFGSLTLCHKMGLTMFTGDDGDDPVDAITAEAKPGEPVSIDEDLSDDVMWQLSAFFWMQSAPVADVLKSVRQDTWRELVEEFQFYLPIHEMGNLMGEVNRISQMAASAAVDILPQDSDDGEGDTPGES